MQHHLGLTHNYIGLIDLTGAKLEFAENNLDIISGKIGLVDPASRLVKGHLSVISPVKPNLRSSQVRIGWQDLAFELMMISLQGLTHQDELKLKFIARSIPGETEILLLQ